ncbi:MAG: LysM peptidoglycan-binding domain-containing protein [Pseudomonadota bacterium]
MGAYRRDNLFTTAALAAVIAISGCSKLPFLNDSQTAENAAEEVKTTEPARPLAPAGGKPSTQQPSPETPPGDQIADLWQRIRSGFALVSEPNGAIDDAVNWFQANQSVVKQSSERSVPLLYHIVERIEARRLPTELALIPLLESGYRVHARSPFGAVGPWQFMPATGRQYGLSQTRYLDQRKDIVLSTKASLDYLETLHAQFNGDWLLAIAAYNGGPGNVSKALDGEDRSFWHIRHRLPKETQAYVPKLLAAARIIANPKRYAQAIHSVPDSTFFDTIRVTGPVDFSVLNKLPNWDETLFRRLNGALLTPYFGASRTLDIRVPRGTGDLVKQRLAEAGPPNFQHEQEYIVRRGDTLGQLAIRFDVSLRDLQKVNGLQGVNIRAGKKLLIPTSVTAAGDSNSGQLRHIIKPGDSFWTLGRRHGVSARTLARHNGLSLSKTLYPGQLILIPNGQGSGDSAVRPPLNAGNYMVTQGDSLWSIARRFKVRLTDLKRWNPLLKSNLLRPGQILSVQAPQTR